MSKIVASAASMTSHGVLGSSAAQNDRILRAMVDAVARAHADGITDPEAIRKVQLDARDREVGAA